MPSVPPIFVDRIDFRTFQGSSHPDLLLPLQAPIWRRYFSGLFTQVVASAFHDRVEAWLTSSSRVEFSEMGSALLELVPATELANVGLLILCHYTPDATLGASILNFLAGKYSLSSETYCLSDHGTHVSLAALPIAARYLESAAPSDALILVLDQTAFAYASPIDGEGPFACGTLIRLTRRPEGRGLGEFKGVGSLPHDRRYLASAPWKAWLDREAC